jgi:hypothetical protein
MLFRSEEKARAWMTKAGTALVGVMTLDQCWAISETWYAGRLDLGYQRPPVEHYQSLLAGVGLVGNAWSLTPPA